MKQIAAITFLLFTCYSAFACSPKHGPNSHLWRWALPEEAQSVVPYVVTGTVQLDSEDTIRKQGFRLVVDRWVKGTGPNVLFIRGDFYSDKLKLPRSSCSIQMPLEARIAVLLQAVDADGKARPVGSFTYLDEKNLFVRSIWRADELGL